MTKKTQTQFSKYLNKCPDAINLRKRIDFSTINAHSNSAAKTLVSVTDTLQL